MEKKDKEKQPLERLCYTHMIENKVAGDVYPHEQICIRCLDKKVDTLWEHLGKQLEPKYWAVD